MSDFLQQVINIPKGTFKRIDLSIARLPSHTLIEMPIFVFRGKQAGKSLLLTAGIHGDEINGIMMLRQMISEHLLMPDRGTVIVIPLVNVYGFLQSTRELPDGRDLNRSFPGTLTGSLATRIAYILMHDVVPFVDFGVDFHTGGNRITNYPQIRCVFNDEKNIELATAFSPPFLLNSGLIEKSFRKEAANLGKSILVYEGGESLRLDEFSIREGRNGIKRLMHHLEMKEDDCPATHETIILHKTSWVRAKASGLFDTSLKYGEKVYKDQILAHITDPYGTTKIAVKCKIDGYIVGINNMPIVNAGDALIHIGERK